jgi:hypothetical protein
MEASGTVERQALEREPLPTQASEAPARRTTDPRFRLGVMSAVSLGAAVRLRYLFHGAPAIVSSDGFIYAWQASRIADSLSPGPVPPP